MENALNVATAAAAEASLTASFVHRTARATHEGPCPGCDLSLADVDGYRAVSEQDSSTSGAWSTSIVLGTELRVDHASDVRPDAITFDAFVQAGTGDTHARTDLAVAFTVDAPALWTFDDGAIARLVQVGIRTLSPHQRSQAERYGVEIATMAEFHRGVRPQLDGPCYLTFDLDALERTLSRPEVVAFYTMPTFHNPLGTTTSLSHRRRLLEIAHRTGVPIIEDGFEMDLRFAGRPVPPLAALDDSGLVVHLFSFSKSLFPGVRVGASWRKARRTP